MADNGKFPPYTCTLTPELIEKAKNELNEKPEWRERDIQALRNLVLEHKELHIRTDDAFLLRFLRSKKFDYDRAMAQILKHFEMKVENKELFTNLRPSAVKHILEAGVTGILPNRDKMGRRVILFRPGRWDPAKYAIDDVFRTNFITMLKIIQEEETQINGVVMMVDLMGVGFGHAKNISPFYAKRVMSLLQDAFPARFKALHYLNEPIAFDFIFTIMKQFMKAKTVNRLHFHGGCYDKLKDFIEEEDLPQEYDGKAPEYSNKFWMDKLLECDAEYDEEAKYGIVPGTVQKQKQGEDAMESLAGTYRKLNVD